MNKVITLLITLLLLVACGGTSEEVVQAVKDDLQNQPTPINPTTIDETDFFSNFSF